MARQRLFRLAQGPINRSASPSHARKDAIFYAEENGSIDCSDWSWDGEWPVSGEGIDEQDKVADGTKLPRVESVPHMKNWLECLRTRNAPNASMEVGYAQAVAGIMADESFIRGKRMAYDAEKRRIYEA